MKAINEMINERSSNRRDILRTKLTAFAKNYMKMVENQLQEMKPLQKYMMMVALFFQKALILNQQNLLFNAIYGHSDWETDESDYYICIGNPNKGGKEIEW